MNSGAGSPDLLRPAAPTGIAAVGAGLVALPACSQAVTDGDCYVQLRATNPTSLLKVEPKRCSPALRCRDLSCSLLPVRDGARCVAVGNLSPVTLPKWFGVTLLAQYLELHISRLRLHIFTLKSANDKL